jgi:hypothetical protein
MTLNELIEEFPFTAEAQRTQKQRRGLASGSVIRALTDKSESRAKPPRPSTYTIVSIRIENDSFVSRLNHPSLKPLVAAWRE